MSHEQTGSQEPLDFFDNLVQEEFMPTLWIRYGMANSVPHIAPISELGELVLDIKIDMIEKKALVDRDITPSDGEYLFAQYEYQQAVGAWLLSKNFHDDISSELVRPFVERSEELAVVSAESYTDAVDNAYEIRTAAIKRDGSLSCIEQRNLGSLACKQRRRYVAEPELHFQNLRHRQPVD